MAYRLFGAKSLSKPMLDYFVEWDLGNKFPWKFKQNAKLFFHENAFENIICEMAAILSREDELRVCIWHNESPWEQVQ